MVLPVSIIDAAGQLQLDEDDVSRDAEVQGFIDDAAAWVETYTGHILEARDVTETLAGFGRMQMRAWPVAADAVVGVAYADAAGSPIGVAGARIDVTSRPARVLPMIGGRWPAVAKGTIVTATVRAGYEEPEDVPRELRRAMLVLISAYDADREGGDILAKAEASARRLCDRHRLRRL